MIFARIMAVSAIAASISLFTDASGVRAESLEDAEIPAEFPPASFKGKQYVDSRGCVYIRAGIDGQVTWVPRVSSNREVLCGYQPTYADGAVTPAPAETADTQVSDTADQSETAAAETSETPPDAKAQAVSTETAKVAAPTPKKSVRKPAKKPVKAKRRVAAKPASKPRIDTSQTGGRRFYACVGANGRPARCGLPPDAPRANLVLRKPVTEIRNGKKVTVLKRVKVLQADPSSDGVSASTRQIRVVPRHVWEQQQASQVNAPTPKGYRRVWKDDRLNKKRAHQTIEGIQQTNLIWSRTVPRRLYERKSGREVTHRYPGLKYPYYSYAEMRAAGYEINDRGE